MRLLTVILLVYIAIFSILSIRNHELYQTFGWDLGFFDQLLWQASRGRVNFESTIGEINLLGDHFQPVLYLLAPFYWLWDDVRVILVAQAFLVAVAAIPLYLLARRRLGDWRLALAVAMAYLLYPGTQFTITNEFHQSAFVPLFLALGLYLIEAGRRVAGATALLGLLLVREEMGVLLVALGLMFVLQRRWRLGVAVAVAGLAGFLVVVNLVIPAVSSQGRYVHYGYGELGVTPEEVLASAIARPDRVVGLLTSPRIKLVQGLNALTAFGGLPLLAPTSLVPVVEQYAVRFVDTRNTHRWLDTNHYAAPLGPLLAWGMVGGIEALRRCLGERRWFAWRLPLSVAIALVSVANSARLHGPVGSVFKRQLYETPGWVVDANQLAAAVPAGARVSVNNSLAPQLTHRDVLYLLPRIDDAEFVAVDLHPGPNKFAPWSHGRMSRYVEELVATGEWGVVERFGEALLLRRGAHGG